MKSNWKTLTSLGFPVSFFELYRGAWDRLSIHSRTRLYALGSAETAHPEIEMKKGSTTTSIKFMLRMILRPVKIEKWLQVAYAKKAL